MAAFGRWYHGGGFGYSHGPEMFVMIYMALHFI